jgi:hypothetical protein
MKILVFGPDGPLGRRSTEAARTQSLNLGRRLPRAVARVWPNHQVLLRRISLEATMWDHADAALDC